VEPWKQYQEDVASFFRNLGYDASTDLSVEGVRAMHDLDVGVSFTAAGQSVMWVIECKLWKRAVPKERVLTLDGVVRDVGADRGILVAENGYQVGAIRAAEKANITLTSLAQLSEDTEEERTKLQVQSYIDRIALLSRRVAKLWPWTTPQTQQPAFPMSELLEGPASLGFELQMIIAPRLLTASFPVVLPSNGRRISIDTLAELDESLKKILVGAERTLVALEGHVSNATNTSNELINQLGDAVKDLLATGRSISESVNVDTCGSFVEAMRAIDRAASRLKTIVPENVRAAVNKVMQFLCDSTYVVTFNSIPSWDADEDKLNDLLSAVKEQLDNVAV
jgi:hypothetical protein